MNDRLRNIERSDEWLTMQAALAFDGFKDAAETERVTIWAAEEIESLRHQLAGAVEALTQITNALVMLGNDVSLDWIKETARKALDSSTGGQSERSADPRL